MPALVRKVNLTVRLGSGRFVFGAFWLCVAPLMTWGVRALYVPLLGAPLTNVGAWLAAGTIVGVTTFGLVVHSFAHVVVARLLRSEVPPACPVYPLGDAAQVWPVAKSAAAEGMVAAAGPLASLLTALLASMLWEAQVGTFVNTVASFIAFSNIGIAVINLTPAFPFDGGRLLRAFVWGRQRAPTLGTNLAYRLGVLSLVVLFAWSGFLAWQRLRFSAETSVATLIVMALTAIALFSERTWHPEHPAIAPSPPTRAWLARIGLIGMVVLVLASASGMLLPMNSGLEAPGSAVPIEPMVQVPPDRIHRGTGTLMLTTVIPQAPIIVGEWLYAHVDHAVRLTSASEIVPSNTTPQELARQGLRDLQLTEKTAIVVGLNLAGFPASLEFTGVEVVGLLADSKASGMLAAGDQITAVNGRPVSQASDVSQILTASPAVTTAEVEVRRSGRSLSLDVPLTPSGDVAVAPRLGISVAPTGDRTVLPFPVTITPQKIDGGPSAGLMFTLAVYNVLTTGDLAGGRRIAGTGTIDLNGNVGEIGGVQQKVAAAERAGAEYFLSPSANYPAALKSAKHIKVVKVATVQDAVAFLRTLTPAR